MKVGFDRRIQRFPLGGTGRYATELLRAMPAERPEGFELVPLDGWPRLDPASSRLPRPVRRAVNAATDVGWLSAGAAVATARHRLGAWYSPSNTLPRGLPRPAVVTIHDLNVLVVPELYDRGYVRFAEGALRHSVRVAERIVVPSEHVRGQLIAMLGGPPERIRAIPEGLDHGGAAMTDGGHGHDGDKGTASNAGVSPPYALVVGHTEPHKNIRLLLEAWRAGVPDDLALVVCGPPGRDDSALRLRATDPGLAGRVVFTGPVSDRRLAALYRSAALFLFPSLAEGFGLPPLEAMRHGTPTAVADAGSLPEVTAGAALLFDPHDPEALARLVTRMRQDATLASELRRKGPEVAARYRWRDTARGVWQEIGHAVGR